MRVRLPEASLSPPSLWPALPAISETLTDPHGLTWRVEWRSECGNVARLRSGGIVRSVTRERVADWRRDA